MLYWFIVYLNLYFFSFLLIEKNLFTKKYIKYIILKMHVHMTRYMYLPPDRKMSHSEVLSHLRKSYRHVCPKDSIGFHCLVLKSHRLTDWKQELLFLKSDLTVRMLWGWWQKAFLSKQHYLAVNKSRIIILSRNKYSKEFESSRF